MVYPGNLKRWTGKTGGPVIGLDPGRDHQYPKWSQAIGPAKRKIALLAIADFEATMHMILEEMATVRQEQAAEQMDRLPAMTPEELDLLERMHAGRADRAELMPARNGRRRGTATSTRD